MHTNINVNSYVAYESLQPPIPEHIHTYIFACVKHAFIHKCTSVFNMHAYIHTYCVYRHAYIHPYTHVHTYVYRERGTLKME